MNVAAHDDAAAFLEQAATLLLADEARHNLVLGIAGTIRDHPSVYPERRLWVVLDGGRPVGAALQTPPFKLALARPESDPALDALVDALADEELPGVVGALPEADAFAARWPRPARRTMTQGVYVLERVAPVPRPPGAARRAAAADRELAVRWLLEFADEARHDDVPGIAQAERLVDHRLHAAEAGLLLWEDGGEIVSLAGWGGPTPKGVRVGPVYTPPPLRGRGYATALVAELSQRLLAGGARFCFLYTDLANPTSNAIYERIGYVRACESAEIAFDP